MDKLKTAATEVAMGLFGSARKKNEITAHELNRMLAGSQAIVVDVREPDEFASGHIKGALNLPLSLFDPARLPHEGGRTVVLQCAGGKRSGIALDQCARARAAVDTHLAGGIGAWMAAGLPVVRG